MNISKIELLLKRYLINNCAISLFFITIFLSGCESTAPKSKNATQIPLKTFTYKDGMTCRETTTPMFPMLGFQCICSDPYQSDNYNVKSNKPGYTAECQNPSAWAINQDRIATRKAEEAKIKAEQERIRVINAANEAKLRADTLKKIDPYLRPYCQALERRKNNISAECATAGNPSFCMNSRDESVPIPSLPKELIALTASVSAMQCYIQGFNVYVKAREGLHKARPNVLGQSSRGWENHSHEASRPGSEPDDEANPQARVS